MLGQTLSHYRIISQLGVGGMGVVYEGVDPRLGRPVAIKFVPEEFANDLKALERLRSEARTASGLNHPNICTIYDVGEHEGRPFIVMELLKGQTLRDRIATKPLKMHEAIDVGIQVADALDCAHGQHIIHRDIKPANLFVVDRGQIKVLDFGLAKLVNRELGTQMTLAPTIDQTAAGVAMGTVAYMSPEQVQGEDLDGRTDLFALGVVLYECVTGHQPFKGKTSAVVFSQILTQAPTAPVALNPDVPARLQDVINNCLEKDRELRYQEAAGLRADLRRVKRDLESGASAVARTGAVTVSLSGVGARQSSGARTTTSVPIGDSAQTRAVSASSATSSGRLPWLGVGLVVAAFVVGAGFYLSRGRVPESSPASLQPVAVSPSSV
ncbi:MAG: serine/threonine-protein kinase, partial [Vicinamibacterales bacterium]